MTGTGPERGARWPRYRRPGTDEIEREAASPEAVGPRRRPGRPRRVGWGVVAAAAVAAGGAVLLVGGGEQAPDPLPREERYAPIATDDALAGLGTALAAQSGGTQVLEARFAGADDIQVTTPPAAAGDLAEVWRWDGATLEKWMGEQVRDREPFDLASVDAGALVALDQQARERSDGDISSSRAHVRRPVTETDHWVYLRVSEVDHGAVVLWAGLDGDVESDLVNESWRDD